MYNYFVNILYDSRDTVFQFVTHRVVHLDYILLNLIGGVQIDAHRTYIDTKGNTYELHVLITKLQLICHALRVHYRVEKGGKIMEARGRRLGSIFPGYDGPALPRAIRSSRVQIPRLLGYRQA